MQVHFRPKERAPDELGGVKIAYAKVTRKGHRLAWYLILLAVLSPIALLALGVVGSWLTLSSNGTVLLDTDEIRATRAGRVSELTVAAGDVVSAGKTLARLENAELDAAAAHNTIERQAAAAARESATAARQSLSDETQLRARLVHYQEERRAAIAQLVSEGAATAAELNAAESALTDAEVGLAQARAAGAARATAVSTAEVDHELLAGAQHSLTLTAPYGGRVLDLLAKPGQYVTAGEPVILLARLDNPRVVAYASPKFGSGLKVGMQATIRFPDGTRTLASIAEPPRLTQRMPADLVDQFGLRPMTVVLKLLPAERLSDNQRVQGLPVSVRFHYDWESTAIGRGVGSVLGVLSH